MRAVGSRVTTAFVLFVLVAGHAPLPAIAQSQADHAAEVLGAARHALGGSERLTAVRTFVAAGRTRQVRGDSLLPIEFQMFWESPDKYVRRDEFPTQDSGPATLGFNGNTLIQTSAPANRAARVATVKEDFTRLMLGLFAGSVSALPLTFTYIGLAEAPQGQADVLEATGPADVVARFFVDRTTHLPIMATWQAAAAGTTPPRPPVEHRLYFSEYRAVEGLRWPFRIRRAIGPDPLEEMTFDRFRINVTIDPKRFAVLP